MNLTDLGHSLDEALAALERKEADPARRDAFARARAEARSVIERTESLKGKAQPYGTYLEAMPHPHPRSRVYRAQPWDWEIHDVSVGEVRERMRRRCERVGAGTRAAVVFDLDGTMFDVGPRTLGILHKWLSGPDAVNHPEALRSRAAMIGVNHVGYSLMHAFENAGFDLRNEEVAGLVVAAEREWRKRFFDGRTLVEFDVPVPGAPAFASWCQAELGLQICYLSGRHERVMAEGTRAQLEKHGFPWEGTRVYLKPNSMQDDCDFKREAFASIAAELPVAANFENEYVNIAAMSLAEPDAVHVILDSQHSGRFVPDCAVSVLRLMSFAD